ncbi:hypothetical protein CK203_056928 [Vitis vinifera]|uniref:Uncharacterized protein n=1 Tax=Vitis vinifera TaxID=29760 RepID=A0A438FUK0_VITVI|nr:hypothetical protein CK203_056928 [Vitis vinifera]
MTTHRVRDPTVIHFTIDGRHGILGARHIVEALHIPYEPIPTEIIPPAPAAPSTVPTLRLHFCSSYHLEAPPVVPATSAPPPSKSSITISTLEFRGLCHTLQTLSTTQNTTTFGYSATTEHDMPGPSEPTAPSEEATPAEQAIPSQEATPAEQTMPHEETTTAEVETPI